MPELKLRISMLLSVFPFTVAADPSLERSISLGSQVEIANCVAKTEAAVDDVIEIAFDFARDAAREFDEVTGREGALLTFKMED